jgi:hypothetical protein
MWSTEYSTRADVAPGATWAVLRAWHTGAAPAPGGDGFALQGPFAVGSVIAVTPRGPGALRSTIVELAKNRVFANETNVSGLALLTRYTLRPLDDGGTRVSHSLAISGPGPAKPGPTSARRSARTSRRSWKSSSPPLARTPSAPTGSPG